MKPIQKLARLIYKLDCQQPISEQEWREGSQAYQESQTLLSVEMFEVIARYLEKDLPQQPGLIALAKRWKDRFEAGSGVLNEQESLEFVTATSVATDLRRLYNQQIIATHSRRVRGIPVNPLVTTHYPEGGWAMIICTEGIGELHTAGKSQHIVPGDCILFGPNSHYDYHRHHDADLLGTYWIYFRAPEDWEKCLQWPELSNQVRRSQIEDTTLWEVVLNICKEIVSNSKSIDQAVQGLNWNLVEQLLWRCYIASGGNPIKKHDQRLDMARRFISENYNTAFTIKDVAALALTSPSTLSRLFKKELGVSIMAWRDDLRILKACELLRESQLPIADIAAAAGYNEPSFFNRVFRKRMGIGPKRYRQKFPD